MAYIIPTLCRSCGACEEACPEGAIYVKFGRYRVDEELCVDCGVCRSACPQHYPAPDIRRVTAYDAARERRIRELEAKAGGQEAADQTAAQGAGQTAAQGAGQAAPAAGRAALTQEREEAAKEKPQIWDNVEQY